MDTNTVCGHRYLYISKRIIVIIKSNFIKMDLKVIFKITSKGKDNLLRWNYDYFYKRPIISGLKDKKCQASLTIQNDTNKILKINVEAISGTSELDSFIQYKVVYTIINNFFRYWIVGLYWNWILDRMSK